jgi:hypothetical protein
MNGNDMVQLTLPVSLLEKLLRQGQLHLEQLHSLDSDSHCALQRVAKQALVTRRE